MSRLIRAWKMVAIQFFLSIAARLHLRSNRNSPSLTMPLPETVCYLRRGPIGDVCASALLMDSNSHSSLTGF